MKGEGRTHGHAWAYGRTVSETRARARARLARPLVLRQTLIGWGDESLRGRIPSSLPPTSRLGSPAAARPTTSAPDRLRSARISPDPVLDPPIRPAGPPPPGEAGGGGGVAGDARATSNHRCAGGGQRGAATRKWSRPKPSTRRPPSRSAREPVGVGRQLITPSP